MKRIKECAQLFGENGMNLFQGRVKTLREWKFQALLQLDELMFADPAINEPVPRTQFLNRRIHSFDDNFIYVNLNFKSRQQLYYLLNGRD